MTQIWLAVDRYDNEFIYTGKPEDGKTFWFWDTINCIELPKGSIEKLIGRKLALGDEPVMLKD